MNQARQKMIVYQVMTRLFGNKMSVNKRYGTVTENGVGKFNDINAAALDGIRELGVTHVWYTGVLEHALLTDYSEFGIAADHADVVKGNAGSPYAIKDYYDVDPDLAENVGERMREFEALVERTHAHGLKVVIDLVPNHVARVYQSDAKPEGVDDFGATDNQEVSFHPDNNFYYLPGQSFTPPATPDPPGALSPPTKNGNFLETPAKVTGNNEFTATPSVNAWFDTAKLNYGVDFQNNGRTYFDPPPDTWLKMRDIVLYWADRRVDGFRCDMAEMVPVEFWRWLIPQVKARHPNVIFIAETYNPAAYRNFITEGKFDYFYDKVLLYDTLRSLISGAGSTASIAQVQEELEGIRDRMLHFLENHDEQRIASRFFAGDPRKALPAMVLSATIHQGPVMIYFGQEVGEPALGQPGFQEDNGRTTIFDYWGVPEHQKWMNEGKFDGAKLSADQVQLRRFYATLLTFAAHNPAVSMGEYSDLTVHNLNAGNFSARVHAFVRFYNAERLLVVNSFNDSEENVSVQIPGNIYATMGLERGKPCIARALIGGKSEAVLDDALSVRLTLKPHGSFIFRLTGT